MRSRFESATALSLVALITGFSLHAVRVGVFTGQSIPIDSLYVNGTGGEEMGPDYTVTLRGESDIRIRWNMNAVSTREGYAIYCGLQKNGGGYAIVEPEDDITEDLAVPTAYDFECRSCIAGTASSCFLSSNTDYITTYQRSIRVRVPPKEGAPAVLPPASGNSVTKEPSSFVVRGTMGEEVSGESLILKPGSQARFAWKVPTELREPFYSVYCGMKKGGGAIVQVPAGNDSIEQVTATTTYEFACRTCPNWKDYDGYVDPIVPWNNCWNPSNTNYTEIIRKKVIVDRQAVCGNASRETGETCDDGNTVGGDGCGASCATEPNFRCTGTSCVSSVCSDGIDNDGDGTIDAQENHQPYRQSFDTEEQIRAMVNGLGGAITPDPLREREFDCGLMHGAKWSDGELTRQWARANGSYVDNAADIFCKKFQYDYAADATCLQEICLPEEAEAGQRIGQWNGQQMIRNSCYPNGVKSWAYYQYFNSITCVINPDCSDGVDNDFDGKTDLADGGCTNKLDTSELAADNGCTSPEDPSEGDVQAAAKSASSAVAPAQASSLSASRASAAISKKSVSPAFPIVDTSRLPPMMPPKYSSAAGDDWFRPVLPPLPYQAASAAASVPEYAPSSVPVMPAPEPPSLPSEEKWSETVDSSVSEQEAEEGQDMETEEEQERDREEVHAAASSSESASSTKPDVTVYPLESWPGLEPAEEESLCRPDSCAFGRVCIELPKGLTDCVLKQEAPDPADIVPDANYPILLEENNDAMRSRCTVLNAIWSAEGYACQETFEFPYIKRVPVTLPLGGNLLRWLGTLFRL